MLERSLAIATVVLIVFLGEEAMRADESAKQMANGAVPAAPAFLALKIEGGFDNAQLHGVRVEDADRASPRVIIAGNLDVEGLPEKGRDVNRFLHWNFRLVNCKGRTVRFELYQSKANLWPSMTMVPTIRYADGQVELVRGITSKNYGPALDAQGQPIRNMQKLGVFFSHRFRDEPATVSYCLPFTNDDIAALAADFKSNKSVTVNTLGQTPLFKLPLYQFVVTDPSVPDRDKKGVWLYAGEDPWEFPGVYALAGFTRFVASDDPLAQEFRRKFVLSAIPHVNPDALHRGDTNFYLDATGRSIINTGLSWKRTDIVANEMIKAAMHKWKDDGRSVDFMTSMHSSCFWTAVMRIDWAYDQAVARKFIDEVYAKKYIPWAAGKAMGTPAEVQTDSLGGHVASKLWPDRTIHFGQHLEQIVLPKWELLGLKEAKWPEELPTDYLRCQKDDLYTQGELFARAVAEFYGVTVPSEKVPPFLMCGDVDQYTGKPGEPRAFSVLYRDLEGREPRFVKLSVGGKTVEMKRAAGQTAVKGFLYEGAVPLSAGDNSYSFEASNGIQAIRYPRTGSFLGPYVVEQP